MLSVSLIILGFMVQVSSAYIFDFSLSLEGPSSRCTQQEIEGIFQRIENSIDGNLNKFLRQNGYPGFIQIYTLENINTKSSSKPHMGAGKCESCPLDNQDAKPYLRRKLVRSLEPPMSKQELNLYVNQQLSQQAYTIFGNSQALSDLCSSGYKEWQIDFTWL